MLWYVLKGKDVLKKKNSLYKDLKHSLEEIKDYYDINKQAVKHDIDKPRMSLVPTLALIEIAKVMTYGAKKYDSYNWAKGFDWTRLLDASMRHLMAFNKGEDNDQETGYSHLAHAACCVMMLYDTVQLHPEKDNRFKYDGTIPKESQKNISISKNKRKTKKKETIENQISQSFIKETKRRRKDK